MWGGGGWVLRANPVGAGSSKNGARGNESYRVNLNYAWHLLFGAADIERCAMATAGTPGDASGAGSHPKAPIGVRLGLGTNKCVSLMVFARPLSRAVAPLMLVATITAPTCAVSLK